MRYENVWVVAGVAALGGAIAAVGGVMGWLPAPVAVAVLLGAAAVGAVLVALRRRARRRRAAAEPPERIWRRADGPWPAYDRRRSAGTPGEPALPAAVGEPQRDRQPAE
jgi:hypothetical protein